MNLLTQHQQNKPQPSSSSLQQLKASNKVAAPSAPLVSDSKHLTHAGAAQGRYSTTLQNAMVHFLAQGLGKVGLSQPFPAKHAKLFPRNRNLPAAIHVQLLANRKRHASGHRLLSLNITNKGQREPLLAPFCQSPQQNSCIFCAHIL